jgi:ATP-dependent DNA helicase RecQ
VGKYFGTDGFRGTANENLTADDFLFVELKKLRSEIAKRESVPAYIVFTDAALKDMCRIKPVDIPHFLAVSGVGNAKAEKYGKEFCSFISDYLEKQKVSNS